VTILLIFDEISKEKWENQLKLKITKCVVKSGITPFLVLFINFFMFLVSRLFIIILPEVYDIFVTFIHTLHKTNKMS
jgi:hypothetical protein